MDCIRSRNGASKRTVMSLIVSGSHLSLQAVERLRRFQHNIDYGSAHMIFGGSGIHDLNVFQSVDGCGVKQLIKILERHISGLAIQNDGYVRCSRQAYQAIVVCNAWKITKGLKDISHRFVPDYRREVNHHNAFFSGNLWLFSLYYDFIELLHGNCIFIFHLSISR